MATVLLFVELSADIIFCIFAHCDIASVVSVAQTCRYLHSLAFEKTVWIVLLADLRRRCILDRNCTPDLETLSTAEMIGVARRLLTGPQTWSPGKLDGNSMAESSRKITLHPYTIAGNRDWNIAKLLRSGRYVLFTHSFRLGCWSVADDKLVWMYTTTIEDEKVYGFAAEETEANATIMVCVCANLGSDTQRNYVEMVNLDLETGTHTSLLIARAPDSDEGGLFSGPVICGALAVASMPIDAGRKCAIVLNWKEQSYFVLHGRSLNVAVIPGHLLLSDREHRLHLISGDTLSTYATLPIGIDGPTEFSPVSVEDIPKLSTLEDFDTEQDFDEMHVHESPIRDGDYSVWIYGTSHVTHRTGAFLSYRLSIPIKGEPRWHLLTRSVLEPSVGFLRPITYHGYFVALMPSDAYAAHVYPIVSAASAGASSGTAQVELPTILIDITPYSGALTCATKSSIVIQYYR